MGNLLGPPLLKGNKVTALENGDHIAPVYEATPLKDHRGVDLISDVLPFGQLWYGEQMQSRVQSRYEKFFKFLKLNVLLNFSFSVFRIFSLILPCDLFLPRNRQFLSRLDE
jgi:hypothetical protein